MRRSWKRAFRLPLTTPEALREQTDEEVRFHIDMRVEQLVRGGMSEHLARAEAIERFAGPTGSLDDAQRDLHAFPTRRAARMTTIARISESLRDVRLAVRSLGRAPAFVALAVLTLALGIGASTAIFSVVRGIALRPLPYHEPERLVRLSHESMETVAPATYLAWRRDTRAFEHVAFAEYWSPNVAGADHPEEVAALRVGIDLIPMLGMSLAAGRAFLPDEVSADRSQVVMLSHRLWQERFGGDPGIVGRTMLLDGQRHTIVGVMPRETPFVPFWAADAQLVVPWALDRRANDFEGASLRVVARMRPGVSLDAARADLERVAARLGTEHPRTDQNVVVTPLHDVVVGKVRGTLFTILAAVGCVLLIACANVAHLQLMRNASRAREFAIRTALGGTRGRLLRQSLLEGGVIATAAGLFGLVLAQGGVRVLLALAPSGIPRLDAVRIDAMVLAFTLGVSVLAALLFGVLPALFVGRGDLQATLRDGSRGTGDGRQRVRARSLLVISEFAMALVLLTTAGLVVRTVTAMLAIDAGYDPRNVISMRISLRGTPDTALARRAAFFTEAIARAEAVPGVGAASMVNHLPLHGDQWRFPYIVEGAPPLPQGERQFATFRVARDGYFRVMRIPLLRGRDFLQAEVATGARVIIINETIAKNRWPNGDAVGQRIAIASSSAPPEWYTVVGVVREVRQGSWTESGSEEMYFPQLAVSAPSATASQIDRFLNPVSATLVARTATDDPASAARPVADAIRALNPDVAISDIITMRDAVAEEFAVPRFYLTLFGIFAAVALVLALVGVYGVLSYSVTRRRRELGLRLALGASRSDPFRLVIGQGARLVAWGTVAGVLISLLVTRSLSGLLFGVTPTDPITLVAASGILASVALLGCIVPAWRAATLDPIMALRAE